MYRYLAYAPIVILIGSSGCATGPGMKSVSALVVQHIETLELEEPYTTHEVIRVNVSHGNAKWTAFVGPNPGQDGPAQVTLTTNSDAALLVVQGWIYASGQWPTGKTTRVTGGSTGTTIIVQHEGPSDGGIHRVFYLAGGLLTKVKVTLDGDPDTLKKLNQTGTYFEIGPNDPEIPEARSIEGAPDNIIAFLDYVNGVVQTATGP